MTNTWLSFFRSFSTHATDMKLSKGTFLSFLSLNFPSAYWIKMRSSYYNTIIYVCKQKHDAIMSQYPLRTFFYSTFKWIYAWLRYNRKIFESLEFFFDATKTFQYLMMASRITSRWMICVSSLSFVAKPKTTHVKGF